MSVNTTIWAIKIKVLPVISGIAEHTELGFYVKTSEIQEIRWTEMPVVGLPDLWTSGIIAKNGIGAIKREMDTRRGGAPEAYSGLDLIVLNNNNLILRLKEIGININGLTAEVHEFIGTDADSDSVETSIRFTGVCAYESGSSWSENLWRIQIKNNRYQRNAFLGTLINNDTTNGNYPLATDDMNGKIVPITFGKFQMIGATPNPAKFIRTAGKQRTLSNSGLSAGGKYFTPIDQSIFPVLGNFVGITSIGSNGISFVGCADKLAVGDHMKIWSGFSDGADKTVTDVTLDMVTVNGSAATSTTLTLIDFLHKPNETESPSPCYVLQLGLDVVGTLPGIYSEDWPMNDMLGFMENLLNKWLQVIEGGAVDLTSLVGKFKKISEFRLFHLEYDQMLVTVAVESFFEKTLSGSVGAGATNQAWVSICDIPFVFSGDAWPMAGFLDDTGALLDVSTAKALWLYAYKSDASFLERKSYEFTEATGSGATYESGKLIITSSLAPIGFKRLAPYGYTAVPASALNYLVINAMMFDGDPTQLLSFDIFPLITLAKYIEDDLTAWGKPTYQSVAGSNLYLVTLTGATVGTNTDISGTAWCDKDDAASLSLSIVLSRTPDDIQEFLAAYSAKIDIDKILNEYDAYFLGINCHTMSGQSGETNFNNARTHIRWRRFNGASHEILLDANGDKFLDRYPEGGDIVNLPDFYYLNRTLPDNNSAFFYEKTLAAQDRKISGYKLFQFQGISSVNQLRSILEIGFLFGTYSVGYNTVHKSIQINELSLICQMSASIASEIYPLCSGRIFANTWGSRKTSADLINNPVDLLEHIKRLQCGMEFGDVVEFGKAYSPSMPIKTGTGVDGSYDHAILADVKTFTPAYQIHDAGQAWTDTQIRNICQVFHLCTYTDRLGYECVTTLDVIDPAATITFSEILPGSLGETQEPEVSDVFCQPIFNYQYNYGSEKFDKQMCVLNIQESVYSAAYTPGIDNTAHTLHVILHDGEYIWTKCKAKYAKYRQIEKCPSDFSDQQMIVTYADAVKILNMKIDWMGKARQPLAVNYTKGKDYHPGKHLKILLPHQTNNYSVECVAETVKISKNKDRVELQVVLLEDVPSAFFFE